MCIKILQILTINSTFKFPNVEVACVDAEEKLRGLKKYCNRMKEEVDLKAYEEKEYAKKQ